MFLGDLWSGLMAQEGGYMKEKKAKFLLVLALLVLTMSLPVYAKSYTAKIGSKKYTSIAAALKAVKKKQTIILLKDATLPDDLDEYLNGRKIVINLKKHKLRMPRTFFGVLKKSDLTLMNGTILPSKSTNIASQYFYLQKKSKLTIKNCKITETVKNNKNNYIIFKFEGKGVTANFINTTFETTYKGSGAYGINTIAFRITDKAKVVIKGGLFSKKRLDNAGGTLKIDGTTLKNCIIYNSADGGEKTVTSTLDLKKVDFRGSIWNHSKMVFRSGKISYGDSAQVNFSNPAPLVNKWKAELVMNGGEIYHADSSAVSNGGTFTMNGGSIRSDDSSEYGGAFTNNGTFIMNGGRIYAPNTYALYCEGESSAKLNGGTIETGTYRACHGNYEGTGTKIIKKEEETEADYNY